MCFLEQQSLLVSALLPSGNFIILLPHSFKGTSCYKRYMHLETPCVNDGCCTIAEKRKHVEKTTQRGDVGLDRGFVAKRAEPDRDISWNSEGGEEEEKRRRRLPYGAVGLAVPTILRSADCSVTSCNSSIEIVSR